PGVTAADDVYLDSDADGEPYLHDCDDADGANYPGNAEVCDGGDNDCDALSDDADPGVTDQQLWYPDCDGDGQGADLPTEACFAPGGPCDYLTNAAGETYNQDCDDGDATVYTYADETCAQGDQNCDGDPDLGTVDGVTYYVDDDNDGYGDTTQPSESCEVNPPVGYSDTPGDCEDGDAGVHPGASDPCGDGLDTDCGGADGDPTNSDPFFSDSDGDGYGDENGAPIYACNQPADTTVEALATDCDDAVASVNPGAEEECNGVDDDCNDLLDDVDAVSTWYRDVDIDGWGDEVVFVEIACPEGDEWSLDPGDCDDGDPAVHPDADEVCNGIDDNCNDLLDADDDQVTDAAYGYVDRDEDGYGACGPDSACSPNPYCAEFTDYSWVDNADDCDDTEPAIHPGVDEVADNDIDEDCDGAADERPGEEPEGGGCGCASTTPSPSWLLVLVPALLSLRRRNA
ncbi:MAG: putative metal-binding motif-containing protein, partial [Myxococcota bacterium]